MIADAGHNMAHLLVGSEGTLAFFTEIELDLQPIPPHRVLGICHFPSFHRAMEATKAIVALGPTAVELVDRTMIELARDIAIFRPVVERFVRGEPEALLLVEFAGEDAAENLRRLKQLEELMGDLGFPGAVVDRDRPGVPAGGLGSAPARPQHHDVDEGRREAGLLHRGLRRAARRSRRIHGAAHRGLRKARHHRHLVRACLGRLLACAPGAQSQAGDRGQEDARHRRRGVRHGAGLQGLAFGRAWRRHRALGIPRADVRRRASSAPSRR